MDGFLRPDTPLLCIYPLPPCCVGDGFLRPDTPLLCIYPLPPCCVGDGFLSVRYTFVEFRSLGPSRCYGAVDTFGKGLISKRIHFQERW